MSKNSELNSRQYLFPIKAAACFFGLLLGFFIFSPKASMQDGEMSGTNLNSVVNGNYRPAAEAKSTIRGRVIYADSGRVVRRAGLMLLPAKGLGGGGREKAGLTNERGEFEIKNVGEGRYFISVSTPGVVTPFSSLSNFEQLKGNNSEMADIARDFQEVVVNGITDVDITVTARRGAAITGRIMYSDGEAAIGVRVEVLRKKDGQYSAVMPNISEMFGAMFGGAAGGLKTDDRGVYRIAALPAGEYIVRVVENVSHSEKGSSRDDEMMALMGFNPNSMVSTYYPNTSDVKKADVIKIELGQEQPEINITIPERALHAISGIVIDKATRQPLKNVRISIKSEDDVISLFSSMPNFGAGSRTNEKGGWSYKDLPAGKYTVTVQPPDNYDAPDKIPEKNPQKPKPPKQAQLKKEFVVEEKDLTDLVLELGYGATVSGTVSFDDQQLMSQTMSVTAIGESEDFSESAFVYPPYSEDGKPIPKKIHDFKIEGIPTGKVFLNVSGRNYGGEQESEFYVKSILLGGKDIGSATLTTKEGEEIKNVQIILSKDVGKLKGKVVRADKSPVSGAKISFVPTDKQKWANFNHSLYAATGGDGEFEISGAPGEDYAIFIKESGVPDEAEKEKSFAERRRSWLEKKTAGAQKITLKAKETEKTTLTLPD